MHGVRHAGEMSALLERWDCPLQRLLRFERAPGVECSLSETHKRVRPVRVCKWSERQRPLEVGKRRGGVEAQGAFAGQGQEPASRGFELGGPIGLSGGAGQVEGGCVVIGQDVGQVLHPARGLRFDPRRGGDMPRGARGAWDLRIGDIARKDVPERILGFALHR